MDDTIPIEDEDDNMLVRREWPRLQQEFLLYLQDHIDEITNIVSHHVPLWPNERCRVARPAEWLLGSFNVCIPIRLNGSSARRYMLKCPFPHRLGGLYGPDLMNEKVRCEAATFAWISENSPAVPVPKLWGFGLPNGLSFTSKARFPWYSRLLKYLRMPFDWILGKPLRRSFVPCGNLCTIKSGYLLMEFVEKDQGVMLSNKWPLGPGMIQQKRNLYKSLARILLDLAHPLPAIASFSVNDAGEIGLTNRPLTLQIAVLENEGISSRIQQDQLYTMTDPYLYDLLRCHDYKLQHQPNSVRSIRDAEGQMAVLTIMRSLINLFTQRELRGGPFIFQLTDLHESNIFVDDDYNITAIVDLEWACSLPIETQLPPFWISGHRLDELEGPKVEDYRKECEEFLQIYKEEEYAANQRHFRERDFCTTIMRRALTSNMHWLWSSLNEPRGMYNIFMHHIQPMFAPSQASGPAVAAFQEIIAPYWSTEDAFDFESRKVDDLRSYCKELLSK